MNVIKTDICVIGAGAGGLSVAAGAAMLGRDTILVEASDMGGDCLNTGCVPSKSLINSANRIFQARRSAAAYGLGALDGPASFEAVRTKIQDAITAIEPHDSVERFEGLGVTVKKGWAVFIGRNQILVGDERIQARKFVIATGGEPRITSGAVMPGVPYFTSDTIWQMEKQPKHLLIAGAGPIGLEIGQAFRRLGTEVSMCTRVNMLDKEDPDLVGILRSSLEAEDIIIAENTVLDRVTLSSGMINAHVRTPESMLGISGDALFFAVGRKPRVAGLNLEMAGVDYNEDHGIFVNRKLQTSNRNIYAVGDVRGAPFFTHAAGYDASIVIRNMLFRLPVRAHYKTNIARITYTDPGLAQVGYTEAEARAKFGDGIKVFKRDLADIDRAIIDNHGPGMIKLIVGKRGRVLGCGIVSPLAEGLIQPWVLAVSGKISLKDLATMVVPYPALGDLNRRIASDVFQDALFSKKTRLLVSILAKLG